MTGNKRDKKNTLESNRVNIILFVKRVILSKYLISNKITINLDMQMQKVRTPNKCVRIKGKVHVHKQCVHI